MGNDVPFCGDDTARPWLDGVMAVVVEEEPWEIVSYVIPLNATSITTAMSAATLPEIIMGQQYPAIIKPFLISN
jgi:hypothetical protein